MKKILALVALVALAGCSDYYDYYKGGVRYTQDGADCIYYSGENARHYSRDVNSADLDKKIVYRNTQCADLYARDMAGQEARQERRVLTPAAEYIEEPAIIEQPRQIVVKPAPVVKKSCGCNKCAKRASKQYVIVSGM
ncbi:MAG: hypothetical protein IJU89_03690 [Alphaproteobacteria bacterium]|nr:hypothetical protein [Alphaproteobacteria bacterium]